MDNPQAVEMTGVRYGGDGHGRWCLYCPPPPIGVETRDVVDVVDKNMAGGDVVYTVDVPGSRYGGRAGYGRLCFIWICVVLLNAVVGAVIYNLLR